MHETESPAPANVILAREDAHFLAVRLRRLCAHLNYTLPKVADDDASLINIAGTVIGALLTNLTHGVDASGELGGLPAEIDRDTDGELLIDWSPGKGRMVTLSLRADGRLSYAFTWDEERAHGTAQMPAGMPGTLNLKENGRG